jgi:hypothetical protein
MTSLSPAPSEAPRAGERGGGSLLYYLLLCLSLLSYSHVPSSRAT